MSQLPKPIRDLTIPEPGSTTAREVLSQSLRKLLRDALELPRQAPASARREAEALKATLEHAAKASPGALVAALRRPTIGTLVRCLRPSNGLPEEKRDALYMELVAVLRHDLALAGVRLPEVGNCRAPARVLSLLDRSAKDTATGQVSRPYTAITRPSADGESRERAPWDLVLTVADNNPIAMEEAHPDKDGNAIDLGGHDAAEWAKSIGESLALVEAYLPDLAGEVHLFVQQFVPVGFFEERHLSATYQEAIGTIYLSLHPSLMTMTEALIHEFSHNKINALFELDELLENAWSPLYTSPVRPDPRPLHGVLLAVHAFLPVARLYEKMIEAKHPLAEQGDFVARFAKIRQTNRNGADVVLGNGKPTEIGRGVLDEIARWDRYYRAMG